MNLHGLNQTIRTHADNLTTLRVRERVNSLKKSDWALGEHVQVFDDSTKIWWEATIVGKISNEKYSIEHEWITYGRTKTVHFNKIRKHF